MTTLTFEPEAHVYHLNGQRLPSVTQVLEPLINYDGVPNGILQHAADRGTAVHLATEFWDDGDLDEESIDPEVLPYVQAWQRFRAESGFVVERSEVRVYSARHRFAGTFDCLGILRGRRVIVEKKTTAILAAATAIQVTAYRRAYNETCRPPERIRQSYSVHLRRDGTYRLDEWTPDEDHWGAFLALLNPEHEQSAATVAAWKAKHL
jgi:hypothetical protein